MSHTLPNPDWSELDEFCNALCKRLHEASSNVYLPPWDVRQNALWKRLHEARDSNVDLPPWDVYAFNMALEINPERDETLRQWRDDKLNRAIDAYDIEATEKHRGYARSHPHFGALPGDIQDANWRRARGVLRICWVRATEHPDADRASEAQSLKLENTLLLEHFKDSLSEVVILASKAHDDHWEEQTHDFPTRFHLGHGKNSGLRVRFLTYSRSLLLDGQNDLDVLFLPPKVAAKGELKFWLIYHPQQGINPPDEGMLRRAYWHLSRRDDHRNVYGISSQTASIAANSKLYCGVGGLEGSVLAAPLGHDCPYKLDWANTDQYWGGDVWLSWITTLFQRSACELLARDTARLGPSLFKGETPEYFDRVTGLSNYWKTVIELESKWIYREFSRSTDVDRIYRNFQEIFDIGEMWTDIREQTELIASHADAERAKKISNIQTLGGVFFAFMVLSASFLGINGIDLSYDLKANPPKHDFFWLHYNLTFWINFGLWAFLSITLFVVGYWFTVTSVNPVAGWLRKLYLAPIPFQGKLSKHYVTPLIFSMLSLLRKLIIISIGLIASGLLAFYIPNF
jgi:hypothetical protein